MNRHERRAARKRGAILVDCGRLQPRDPNYGPPFDCWLCATTHAASGFARITDNRSATHVPFCDACLADGEVEHRVVRKHLGTPDLEISEGGKATGEQIAAMVDKEDTTEH